MQAIADSAVRLATDDLDAQGRLAWGIRGLPLNLILLPNFEFNLVAQIQQPQEKRGSLSVGRVQVMVLPSTDDSSKGVDHVFQTMCAVCS